MQKRLKKIIEERDFTLTQIAKLTGIAQPYLSMMLSGKRPISTANWIKILMKIEGMTRDEAQIQLAKWQIEDAQKILNKNHIIIRGNHNEVNLGSSQDDLMRELEGMSPEERILLKKLIKTLKSK